MGSYGLGGQNCVPVRSTSMLVVLVGDDDGLKSMLSWHISLGKGTNCGSCNLVDAGYIRALLLLGGCLLLEAGLQHEIKL